MFAAAETRFGKDIFETSSIYGQISETDGDTKRYKKDHPELLEYWDLLDEWTAKIGLELERQAKYFPETPTAYIRPDAKADALGAADVLAGMQETLPQTNRASAEVAAYRNVQPAAPKEPKTYRAQLKAWLASLPDYYRRLVEDWVQRGEPLPASVAKQMSGWGITADMLK
jgi:hypothetical protein